MARSEQESNMTYYVDQGLKALEDLVNGDVGTPLHRNRRYGWQVLNVTPGIVQGMLPYGHENISRYMGYTAFRRNEPPQVG